MASRAYPSLGAFGAMRLARSSGREIYLARRCGIAISDDAFDLFASNSISKVADITDVVRRNIRNKYFLIHLVDLYYNWFNIDRPFWALENLIADFNDAETLAVGDGRLPALVAGIGETEIYSSIDDFVRRLRAQVHLSSYVSDACTSYRAVLETVVEL